MSTAMIAVEFQTNITDGTIQVPVEYRNHISGPVRVIILAQETHRPSKIIERLLRNPIVDPSFTPLKRDDIYQGRG